MNSDRQLSIYRRCMPVVDTRYREREHGSVVEPLAEGLAKAEGVDVADLPPLYETIDLDAVSQLFDGSDESATGDAILGFTVGDWNVFVRADGRIRICDGTTSVEPTPVFDTASD